MIEHKNHNNTHIMLTNEFAKSTEYPGTRNATQHKRTQRKMTSYKTKQHLTEHQNHNRTERNKTKPNIVEQTKFTIT